MFIPNAMEHKWAIYHYAGKIIFIRSWLREVVATADLQTDGNTAALTRVTGDIADNAEPAYAARFIDFLIRSHTMGLVYPAPLPGEPPESLNVPAMWCMHAFGSCASFAAARPLPPSSPARENEHPVMSRGSVCPAAAAAR